MKPASSVASTGLARIVIDEVGAAPAGESDSGGESAEVHDGVDRDVDQSGLKRLAVDRRRCRIDQRKGDQNVAGLCDPGIGEQPDDVTLAKRDQVADGHRCRRKHGEHRAPHVGNVGERREHQHEQPDKAADLRCC
jgi:hypothetical protein